MASREWSRKTTSPLVSSLALGAHVKRGLLILPQLPLDPLRLQLVRLLELRRQFSLRLFRLQLHMVLPILASIAVSNKLDRLSSTNLQGPRAIKNCL